LKLKRLGIIPSLPRIFGVQSEHADPVYRYYSVSEAKKRRYQPVAVTPSVAQAAMIGNPVSFPRVRYFAEQYEKIGGPGSFQVIQVKEQDIIEGMLLANRHGHISCTQGGECLAGLRAAVELGLIEPSEEAILDATAHHLKFIGFQEMYFTNTFPAEYGITPRSDFVNAPEAIIDDTDKAILSPADYTAKAAKAVVTRLGLTGKG
ncbi:MAG: threonine synthase, partial [Thermodesulfobacteriota bacterium]